MARNDFSFASVILSYFLVAGGIVLGLIAFALLEKRSEVWLYAAFGAGAFVGGFVAARASHGSTIVEPALGGVLLIGSVVAMAAATPAGEFMWAAASRQIGRFAGTVGAVSAAGALVGAFLSEKLMGEATRSGIPWILYTALATGGACLVAYMAAIAILLQDLAVLQTQAGRDKGGLAFLAGIGAGCFLAGLSVGASSRTRVLVASLLGAAAGAFGFFLLALKTTAAGAQDPEAMKGFALLAAGGGVVTLLGNLIGWALFGRRGAGA